MSEILNKPDVEPVKETTIHSYCGAVIDFHTHTFPDAVAPKAIDKLGRVACIKPHTDGTVSDLLRFMDKADVRYSVTLPVATSTKQVSSINHNVIEQQDILLQKGIIPFGTMHPDCEDYVSELKTLAQAGIKGIKIHPAYQNINIDDSRFLHIIDKASEYDLIVLTHAGIDIGIYDQNYASTEQILHVIDEVHPTRFVLAHMGGWACWKDVEQDLAGAPVWFDSAFTIGPLEPFPGMIPSGYSTVTMKDEDFVRIARKHGMDKILFATDSPWQDQKNYIRRFQEVGLTAEEQTLFFAENAKKLLNI